MTAAARISQADVERVLKAIKLAGWPAARVTLDLEKRVISAVVWNGGPELGVPVHDECDDYE